MVSLYLLIFTFQSQTSVYKTGSACVAFLANTGTNDATVTFNGNSYHLPGWSVSILPDCKSVVLNTAKVCLINFQSHYIVQFTKLIIKLLVINQSIGDIFSSIYSFQSSIN